MAGLCWWVWPKCRCPKPLVCVCVLALAARFSLLAGESGENAINEDLVRCLRRNRLPSWIGGKSTIYCGEQTSQFAATDLFGCSRGVCWIIATPFNSVAFLTATAEGQRLADLCAPELDKHNFISYKFKSTQISSTWFCFHAPFEPNDIWNFCWP